MALIVQKYGGTSVADAERINNVAVRIAQARDKGDRVVVVVSAMGGTTFPVPCWRWRFMKWVIRQLASVVPRQGYEPMLPIAEPAS